MPAKKKPLKIGILDFGSIRPTVVKQSVNLNGFVVKGFSCKKVFSAAIKKLGYTPVIYDVEKCQLFFDKRDAVILYNNKKIKGCDVMLPRLDFSTNIDLEVSIIKQFQLMGIPIINKYLPISRSKNKLRTLQILTKKNIPVPKTIIVRRIDDIDEVIKKLGGYPIVIKAPFGSYGKEVAILESRRSLFSALDIMWKHSRTRIILIQEYVYEAGDSDLRAFVVGDKVVAAMKRTAKKGEFRANIYLGGSASQVKLTKEEEKLAVRATKALGLDVCGVDILRSKSGPVIMETNSNPGVVGIMKVSGVDVVGEIIKYAAKVARKKRK
jgi:ribosomal protein S6--L-glutamate ligase